MLRFSTGLSAQLAEALLTQLNGMDAVIRIWSGPVPLDANAAPDVSCVLLRTITVDDDGTPLTFERVGTVIQKVAADIWQGSDPAAGAASFFRITGQTDDNTASAVAKRIQGTVGLTSASDMTLIKTNYVADEPIPIDSLVIEQSNL